MNKDNYSVVSCAQGGNVYPQMGLCASGPNSLVLFSCRWGLTFVWFRGTLKVRPWCLIFFPGIFVWRAAKIVLRQVGNTSSADRLDVLADSRVQSVFVSHGTAPSCQPQTRTSLPSCSPYLEPSCFPPNQIYWFEKKSSSSSNKCRMTINSAWLDLPIATPLRKNTTG